MTTTTKKGGRASIFMPLYIRVLLAGRPPPLPLALSLFWPFDGSCSRIPIPLADRESWQNRAEPLTAAVVVAVYTHRPRSPPPPPKSQ